MFGGSGQIWILRSFGWSKLSKTGKMWNCQIIFCCFRQKYRSHRYHPKFAQFITSILSKNVINLKMSLSLKIENESGHHHHSINNFDSSMVWTKKQNRQKKALRLPRRSIGTFGSRPLCSRRTARPAGTKVSKTNGKIFIHLCGETCVVEVCLSVLPVVHDQVILGLATFYML